METSQCLSKKAEQALQTRQKILDAAEHVFFEQGVAATTLETIAERAEMTRGAIYWHFKNKHDLLEALLEAAITPVLETLRTHLQADERPTVATLQKAAVAPIQVIANAPSLQRKLTISTLMCERTAENARLLEKAHYYNEQVLALIVQTLEAIVAHDSSLMLTKPAPIVAEAFFCYWGGVVKHFLLHPERMDELAARAEDFADIFMMPVIVRKDGHKYCIFEE